MHWKQANFLSSSSPAKRMKLGMKMNSFSSEFPQLTSSSFCSQNQAVYYFLQRFRAALLSIDLLTLKDG